MMIRSPPPSKLGDTLSPTEQPTISSSFPPSKLPTVAPLVELTPVLVRLFKTGQTSLVKKTTNDTLWKEGELFSRLFGETVLSRDLVVPKSVHYRLAKKIQRRAATKKVSPKNSLIFNCYGTRVVLLMLSIFLPFSLIHLTRTLFSTQSILDSTSDINGTAQEFLSTNSIFSTSSYPLPFE